MSLVRSIAGSAALASPLQSGPGGATASAARTAPEIGADSSAPKRWHARSTAPATAWPHSRSPTATATSASPPAPDSPPRPPSRALSRRAASRSLAPALGTGRRHWAPCAPSPALPPRRLPAPGPASLRRWPAGRRASLRRLPALEWVSMARQPASEWVSMPRQLALRRASLPPLHAPERPSLRQPAPRPLSGLDRRKPACDPARSAAMGPASVRPRRQRWNQRERRPSWNARRRAPRARDRRADVPGYR